MPTLIQFAGGDSITVEEDFYEVTSRVHGDTPFGQFKRVDKGLNEVRVTVYTANIAYIQEHQEPGAGLVA
jgi:hypothetical protein